VGAGTEDIRVITPLGESKVATADHFAFPSFKPTVSKPHAKRSGSKVSTGIKVSCPSGGLSCSGTYKATATVKHHKTKLAGGSISLSAGGSKTISFKLGSKALKQLKSAGKLKITMQFVVADGSQTPIKVNRTITLKYKHKKH
jgi:VCBS repeat-containing protein